MASRKLIAAAALTAAVTAGGVVGATLGVPGVSGAQDSTTTTTAPSTTEGNGQTSGDHGWHHRAGIGRGIGGGIALDAAAEVLGMTTDDLRDALGEGKTLAEIATEQGVERQVLIDALVAAGEAELDEAKAALPDRIAEAVDRTFEGANDRFPIIDRGMDAAAGALGMTEDEVRSALRDNKTLADLAAEKGVDREVVVDALIADAEARIAEKVSDGRLTQAQADARIERLAAAAERVVDGEGVFGRGGFGGRGHGHDRGDEGDQAGDDTGTAEETTPPATEGGN